MFGIVLVHYAGPGASEAFLQRGGEHCVWNAELYHDPHGVLLCLVTEKERLFTVPCVQRSACDIRNSAGDPMPPLEVASRLLVATIGYPKPMPIFSLSKTKNFGLRLALELGCDPIAVTDVDFAWTPEAFHTCRNVQPGRAIVPYVRMVRTYDTREQDALDPKSLDKGMTSTVGMRAADWRRVCYDETYVGYGGEDGKLVRDIQLLGIQVDRSPIMHHIAHDPSASQVNIPGHGRADCWGRDTGFNPDNFALNRNLIDRK